MNCLLPGSDAPFNEVVEKSKKIHKILFMLWIPMCMAVVIMTSWMTHIGVKASRYEDVTSTWQSCLFTPNYVTLPLSDTALAPVLALLGFPISDKQLQLSGFIFSNIYLGTQATIMTFLGQMVLYRSWKHVGWILTSAFFGLWCSLISMTYYISSPVLPTPVGTNSTMILIMYYLKRKDWEDINDGDNMCSTAFNFIVIYIACIMAMIVLMGAGTSLAFLVSYRRMKDPSYQKIIAPHGGKEVFMLTLVMMVTYIGLFMGKLIGSVNGLDALRDSSNTSIDDFIVTKDSLIYYPKIFYPFGGGAVNMTSTYRLYQMWLFVTLLIFSVYYVYAVCITYMCISLYVQVCTGR